MNSYRPTGMSSITCKRIDVRQIRFSLLCLLLCIAAATTARDLAAPDTKPRLIRIAGDGCLVEGQRLQVDGERLGSERMYQLVLLAGKTRSVLNTGQWRDTAITASLPVSRAQAVRQATLVLRDRHTGEFVSNRLLFEYCPAQDNAAARTAPDTRDSAAMQEPLPQTVRRETSLSTAIIQPQDGTPPPIVVDERYVEAQELIVFSDDMHAAKNLDQQISQAGYSIKRRRALNRLGMVISVIRLPDGVSIRDAMQRLQQSDGELLVDANHRYSLSDSATSTTGVVHKLVNWGKVTPACGKALRLGLVDTLVDTQHPSLADRQVATRSFLPLGVPAADTQHATAIASILVGAARQGHDHAGLLPAARLYNAGIFRQRGDGQTDTTAELIISALDWLHGQQVSVINLSLAGNSNRLLQRVVAQLVRQNRLLTAAAGNAGPGAPPAYPAAWPGVVAVTAVDTRGRIYAQANRGDYIDLAAPGVDVWAARPGTHGAYYSGTSYAVPYVTAALAVLRQRNADSPPAELAQRLQQQARDLGAPGRDPVFGHGLLQLPGGCA